MKQLAHIILFALAITAAHCHAAVENLRCEYLINPLGIDAKSPRLSWVIASAGRGDRQTAYQILVASSPKTLDEDNGDLWNTGKVESDETTQIEYSGQPLASRQNCYWKARIWDGNGKVGGWSSPARWQMGLLDSGDWKAQWIVADGQTSTAPLVIRRAVYQSTESGSLADVTAAVTRKVQGNRLILIANNGTLGTDPSPNQKKLLRVEYEFGGKAASEQINENEMLIIPEDAKAVPYLRKTFEVKGPITRAVLYTTALGLYEARINGKRVGDHVLAPDWTDYRKRVRYQAYDVSALLQRGQNAMGALLANGWFSGRIGNGGHQFFGKTPAFLAQFEVTYQDGTSEQIVTDSSWKWRPSPIRSADFMDGEDYDARLEVPHWDSPGLDESQWASVKARDESNRRLESQVMEPVGEIYEIKPKSVTEPKPGCWVYDLGQNMVGVVRLKISSAAGTKITLRHAEMLNPNGTLYTKNLRGATSVDHYICKGAGTEVWQPQFTFHGFRYVEISGFDGKPKSDAVTGIVISSETARAGEFSCSDPRLNQLQSNIQWGQRGNYISIPTDCPQRDERLGWMGDAQVFIRTATYNADVAAFFTKWMVDVDDGQSSSGTFGDISPNTQEAHGAPGWGDAGVICPWTIYQVYGDKRMLERHLPAMTKWVEHLRVNSNGLIRESSRGNDYGDWLSIGADTPKELIATAYFAYSTRLLAESYKAVGREKESAKYKALFQDIKTAFDKHYVAHDGRIKGDTQTDYALALKFDLLPDELRPKAAQYLADDIHAKKDHLSTGFLGVSYLLPVLTDAGKSDTAYKLLLQDSFPSWLFSVKHGATTIWERWDGWTPEKGFQDPGMNSFNHYSLGSCGEYIFGYIGGIRPASAGFKTILIEPTVGNGLTWAKASYNSIRGKIATSWKRDGDRLALNVVIPPNTVATICVPAKDESSVTESDKPLKKAKGIEYLRAESGKIWLNAEAGTYMFKSQMRMESH